MESQIVIPLIITLPLVVFWLWMAWELGKNDNLPGSSKTNWMLAFIFLNVFAAVFYYFAEYKKGSNHWFLVLKGESPSPAIQSPASWPAVFQLASRNSLLAAAATGSMPSNVRQSRVMQPSGVPRS